MKFGVTIPNNWGIEDPQHVLALGPVAEVGLRLPLGHGPPV